VEISLRRPLLCRISLLPDESLLSYLSRLAAANCYEPPSMLTKLCDRYLATLGLRDNLAYPKHSETFGVLASLTCLSPRELANASVHRFAQAPILTNLESPRIYLSDGEPFQLLSTPIRSRHLLRADYARFCPDCLREAAYHRLAWMLKDVSGCLKHRRVLVDRCQNCHSLVPVQDVVRCQCSECGVDLTSAATDDLLDPFGLFAQRTIQAWWGLDTSSADRFAGTLPEQPSPILHRLFQWVMDSIEARRSHNRQFDRAVPDQHMVQSLAFKALTNWPIGFCDFLRKHLEWEVRMYSYLHYCDFSEPVYLRNGSSLAFWICEFRHWPEFSFVQEAVDRFLAANHIQVYSDYASTRILLNADEDLQKIARPIVQRTLDRLLKLVETFEAQPEELHGYLR
jgi:hypothetical protein